MTALKIISILITVIYIAVLFKILRKQRTGETTYLEAIDNVLGTNFIVRFIFSVYPIYLLASIIYNLYILF